MFQGLKTRLVFFIIRTSSDYRSSLYLARDSSYFAYESFACIQELSHLSNIKIICKGDLNARMPILDTCTSRKLGVTYSKNPEPGRNTNGNDNNNNYYILRVCEACDMLIVDHMCTSGDNIGESSELDWALCSLSAANHVKNFTVHNDVKWYKDHYPISLYLCGVKPGMLTLTECAAELNVVTEGVSNNRKHLKHSKIDKADFITQLPAAVDLWDRGGSAVENYDSVFNFLYSTFIKTAERQKNINFQVALNSQQR